MADINSITSAAGYRGDPALGGAIGTGITIDPTPMQRYSTFKYYQDQELNRQSREDAANAAKQIATVAAFDIASPLTPYSDALKTKLQGIQDKIKANPDSLTYSKDPSGYQDLQKEIGGFENLRKLATASDAVYNASKNAIDSEPDLDLKAYKQADLDARVHELFDGGLDPSQGKILATASPVSPDDYKLPDAKITTYDMITPLPNSDVVTTLKYINLDQVDADSEMLASTPKTLDETSSSFLALSPARQELERKKNAILGRQRQQITDISTGFNGLLKQWQAANPNVDINTITGDPTGKDTLMDNIKSANKINSQIDQLNQLIAQGKVKDPSGKVITAQYGKINLADGLSESEVIKMHTLQNSKMPIVSSVTKKIDKNDNAIQLDEHAVQRRGQDVTRMDSKEGHALQLKIAEMKDAEEKAKLANKTGPGGKAAGAITDVAEYMTGHISRVSNYLKNGHDDLIVPEQQADPIIRKALGLKGEDAKGNTIHDNRVSYKQYPDGKISVLDDKGAVVEKLDLNILKQRVAQVLHGNATGDVDPKSQEDIEKGFGGTVDLNKLLQDENSAKTDTGTSGTTAPAATEIPTYSKKDLKSAGWSDAQINQRVKEGKIKVN